MAILEKDVWVTIGSTNYEHYINLGYKIEKYEDVKGIIRVKRGTKILVKSEHLIKYSSVKVTKICDDCGKQMPDKKYKQIMKKRIEGDGRDRCINCANRKGVITKRMNMPYERTLEYFAVSNNKEYLLDEFSDENNIKPIEMPANSWEKLLWNCPKCKSEYPMAIANRTTGECGCPFCAGQQVNNTNCMWATHPEIAKLLTDQKKGFEVTVNTNQKMEFTCPDCGNTDKKYPRNILKVGLGCSKCSDGISYPEKFMINVLTQLDVNFVTQKTFGWSNNKRYDFYIPSLNCIIETNGEQHYSEGTFNHLGGKTLIQEQDNDRLKERFAKENGIKTYIVIDCRESKLEFIKDNIINSELFSLLNLSKIDWLKCHEYACNTLVKVVCDVWSNSQMTTVGIGEVLGFERSTIYRYLIQGRELGWCDYDPREGLKRGGKLNKSWNIRKIIQLNKNNEFIKEWESINEVERQLNIAHSGITKVCKGELQTSGGYKWMYLEDYENQYQTIKQN